MYITRLLFGNNNSMIFRYRAPATAGSLFGKLILSYSRSHLTEVTSSRHHHHILFVQCSHLVNHHVGMSPSVSITRLPLCQSIHTSSLHFSDGNNINRPEESISASSSSSDSKSPPASVPSSPQSKLTISDKARQHLQSVLDPDELLRIGVRGGGCSGFEYEISVIKQSTINQEEDILFENNKVVVDKESIEYMNGAQLEYEEELIRSGFRVVNNPLAEKGCSCGASFSLKF